ncbi:MAG: hypothetical protein ACR2JX_00305 [Mycobacteriales bacterium]
MRSSRTITGASVALAALALAGCASIGSPTSDTGSFHPGPAAPVTSAPNAQLYCDRDHGSFQRVDVVETVVLRAPADDRLGGEPLADAAVVGQFCGTEFRGFVAVVAKQGVPAGSSFRLIATVANPQGFVPLHIFVPADTPEPVQVVISTEGHAAAGQPENGISSIEVAALRPDPKGSSLDNDTRVSLPNPRADGKLGQEGFYKLMGPLRDEQVRQLAVSTAQRRAAEVGIRR